MEQKVLLSTEVTDDDIENGIEDEYGVVYSKNGERLLKCKKKELENYKIKEGTIVICDNAFYYCMKLHKINVPDTVSRIGNSTFKYCTSLQQIIIPYSITTIGTNPFVGCKNIELISHSPRFIVNSGFLINKQGVVISYVGKNVDVEISDIVTTIGCNAFESCEDLKQISIPNTLTVIRNSAFCNCKSLQQVTIRYTFIMSSNTISIQINSLPNALIRIDDNAFNGCEALQAIDIPNSVTTIGYKAFRCCNSLKKVTIPKSVTTIGQGAFEECSSLQKVDIQNSITIIDKHTFFRCTSLKEISISNCVSKIGDFAFYNCKSLKKIGDMFNSVISIGESAFNGCKSLKQIGELKCIKTIDNDAFCDCKSLQQITLSKSITSIGNKAFLRCHSLKRIDIPNSVLTIGYGAFGDCISIQKIDIPTSITVIDNYTFYGCKSLINISIPNSVKTIGNFAFEGCSSLEQIDIANSVLTIGHYAFHKCSALKSVVIPNSVTAIGNCAFKWCNILKQVHISSSVSQIGIGAFECCLSLEEIEIPKKVTKICKDTFACCKSIKRITICGPVTTIMKNAFWGCTSLKKINIPESVTTIEDFAFYSCKSLKRLDIPDSITSIGDNAFDDCNYLQLNKNSNKNDSKIKIVKIVINNFRTFTHKVINLKDFNCIIGKNDAGKTTIFAALEWFFNTNKKLNENDFAVAYYDSIKKEETNMPSFRNGITGEIIPEKKQINYYYDNFTISVDIYFSGVTIPNSSSKYDFIFDKDFVDADNCVCIRKYMFHPLSNTTRKKSGYYIKIYPFNSYELKKILTELSFEELKTLYKKTIYDDKYIINEDISQLEDDMKRGNKYKIVKQWLHLQTQNLKQQICEILSKYYVERHYNIIDDQWMDLDIEYSEPFRLDWFDTYKLHIYTPNTPINYYLNNLFSPYSSNKIYDPIEEEKKRTAKELSVILKENNISENVNFKTNEPVNLFSDDSLFFKQDESPINIPLKNRGEGLQLTIKNAVFKMLAENQSQNRNTIFAFEEPETHLHPSAQIEMYRSIKALSKNNNFQVIMTTHSPYIVKELADDNKEEGENNNNIIIVNRDDKRNESSISTLADCERVLPYVSMNEINFIAFAQPSIEYHIELFGYIHNKLMDKYENDSSFKNDWDSSIVAPDKNGVLVKVGVSTIKGVDVWLDVKNSAKKYKWYDTKSFTKEKRTMPYCVRNNIDHPLTKDDTSNINKHRAFVNNAKFEKYIKQSIDIMRNAIINNPNVFK